VVFQVPHERRAPGIFRGTCPHEQAGDRRNVGYHIRDGKPDGVKTCLSGQTSTANQNRAGCENSRGRACSPAVELVEAKSAAEALDCFSRGGITALVTDNRMSLMNGVEMVRIMTWRIAAVILLITGPMVRWRTSIREI
jgi:hypothetical protein